MGILTTSQRDALVSYVRIANAAELDDEALLEAVAEKIGMTGEMSLDPDGIVELMRGDILVALHAVSDDDLETVDHPEQLQLAVFLRPTSAADRAELEQSQLIEPYEDADADEDWAIAGWGAICTRLPRDANLAQQMEVLEQVMTEAEAVVEGGRHRTLPAALRRPVAR